MADGYQKKKKKEKKKKKKKRKNCGLLRKHVLCTYIYLRHTQRKKEDARNAVSLMPRY